MFYTPNGDGIVEENAQNTDKQLLIKEKIDKLIADSHRLENACAYKEALEQAQEAWHIFQENRIECDARLNADIVHQLCAVNLKLHEYNTAALYAKELLELARSTNDVQYEACALRNLAVTRSVASDYRAAIPLFVESLEKSRLINYRSNEAICLINIGTIYAQLFNEEEALDRYTLVLNDYADIINESQHLAILMNIGNLHLADENYKEAALFFENVLEKMQNGNFDALKAHSLAQLARVELAAGDIIAALEYTRLASEIFQKMDMKALGRQINLLNRAKMSVLIGDTEGGAKLALQGIVASKRLGDDNGELRGYQLLANIFERKGDYKQAFKCQKIYVKRQEEYLKKQRHLKMLDLEIRFSLREKERKIENLLKENHLQALLLEKSSQIEVQNQQLRQANEELQQFAYITSHDLKEPLRMIGSFTQIVQQQFEEKVGTKNTHYFKFISEGVTRMHDLLDALLQYAIVGRTDLEKEPIEIREVVNIARTNLKMKIDESDTRILCGELPKINAVKTLLSQLFQNLIGNAIKFKRPDAYPIILINAEERPTEWLFTVEDNGIGIAQEHLERVFVIFQRLHARNKYEGTGIGLAICHKIITRHGGRIWVESSPEKGSTFYFTLPK